MAESQRPPAPQAAGTGADRRSEERMQACFPATLELHNGVAQTAVLRDASVSGALLLTRARAEIGSPVHMKLYFDGQPEHGREVTGKVVRCTQRPFELSTLWTFEVAVEFNEPLRDCEEELRALAQLQAQIYGEHKSLRH